MGKDFHFAHWNVRSLRGKKKDEYDKEKVESLAKYMDDNHISILGLSETHLRSSNPDTHNWSFTVPEVSPRYILSLSNLPAVNPLSGASKTDRLIHNMKNRHHGVGLMVRESLHQGMEIVDSPDPSRILGRIVTTSDELKVLVIEAYSPTDKARSCKGVDMVRLRSCKEETKIKFYNDLQTMIDTHRGTVDEVLLMGDFNARTGWNPKWSSVIGRYPVVEDPQRKSPLPSLPSDNGLRLLKFCQHNNLIIINNTFRRPKSDKWTWRSPIKTTSRIDFIIKMAEAHSELTVQAFDIHAELDIGAARSDHRLVKAQLRLLPSSLQSQYGWTRKIDVKSMSFSSPGGSMSFFTPAGALSFSSFVGAPSSSRELSFLMAPKELLLWRLVEDCTLVETAEGASAVMPTAAVHQLLAFGALFRLITAEAPSDVVDMAASFESLSFDDVLTCKCLSEVEDDVEMPDSDDDDDDEEEEEDADGDTATSDTDEEL